MKKSSGSNYDYRNDSGENIDGLETVLEVPLPEEMCNPVYEKEHHSWSHNIKNWMKSQVEKAATPLFGCRRSDLQLLLGVLGAPLVPMPLTSQEPIVHLSIKDTPSEASWAQYIVQQYIAASGGSKALNSIKNLYAMGNVKMVASEFETVNKSIRTRNPSKAGEVGCFVLWGVRPDKWCMELVVGGVKLCSGSDGRIVWRQTPWLGSHASRGPPRPLRRSMQGLDPVTTANLFNDARCVDEKKVADEACFVLKLSTDRPTLNARSNGSVEVIRHSVLGYFSQKTGFLVQLEDSQLLRIHGEGGEGEGGKEVVYWETKMESTMEDYRTVDGIKIAHSGRSTLTLFRFGETAMSHTRTKLQELWTIKEVAFNVQGLSMECFLPPADVNGRCFSEACDLIVEERGRTILPCAKNSRVVALDRSVAAFD